MTKAGVKYPQMRAELIETIRTLSDPGYQQRVWVNRIFPRPGMEDSLTFAIHFLYDDMGLDEGADSAIGVILKSENEARLVEAVIRALDRVFEAKGLRARDQDYVSCAEWTNVLRVAAAAYFAMKE